MGSITALVFACVCTLASCAYITKYADNDFLLKQKAVLEVLHHYHQYDIHHEHLEVAKNYNMEENINHYTNPEAVHKFLEICKYHMLPKHTVFTIMNKYHREQAVALYDLFFYAKDWDTLYKTMVWARYNVNEDMFVYVMNVAVLHHPELEHIVLPPLYEVNPYFFFPSNVIQKAQLQKMHGFHDVKKVEDTYTVILPANYTGYDYYTNDEGKLSYFTEDVGLNSFYYYYFINYPVWMTDSKYGVNPKLRGEQIVSFYYNLLARYYMERLSNDIGEIPEFTWYEPLKTGYYPALSYYNGYHFPSRENYYKLYNEKTYEHIEKVTSLERAIRDMIFKGYYLKSDGTQVDLTKPESISEIGNLAYEHCCTHDSYYRAALQFGLIKKLLGGSIQTTDKKNIIPSVLAHYETALRDPVIYQYYKHYLNTHFVYKNRLPSYTTDELLFKGVKIESMEMDKLVTYFDRFDSDITNAVDLNTHTDKPVDFTIKARQWRLNHLPFTTKIYIQSDKAQKAVVRLYMGPKKHYEHGPGFDLNENCDNYVILDRWVVELKAGKNVVSRNCDEFSTFVKDRTTYYELYKSVMMAIKGEMKFSMETQVPYNAFPYRLMLPKGKKGGMPFQFYAIVMPYTEPKVMPTLESGIGSKVTFIDSLSLRFPFDRNVDESHWYTPNMYYHDAMIFHKKEAEIN